MTTESASIRRGNPLTILLTHPYFIVMLRVLLGGLFIFSSVHKIAAPGEFARAVRDYEMLAVGLSNLFALFVSWSEFVAGTMLLLGVMTKKAAGAIFILLAMFTVAITATIIRGIAVDCGCFSNEGNHQTDYTLVIRNLFLIASTTMIMLFDRNALSLSGVFSKRR